MVNCKTKNAIKIYGFIGKSLLIFAGGIVGLIKGSPLLAVTGALVGTVVGYLIERSFYSIFLV
jgi:hypothetical protein